MARMSSLVILNSISMANGAPEAGLYSLLKLSAVVDVTTMGTAVTATSVGVGGSPASGHASLPQAGAGATRGHPRGQHRQQMTRRVLEDFEVSSCHVTSGPCERALRRVRIHRFDVFTLVQLQPGSIPLPKIAPSSPWHNC